MGEWLIANRRHGNRRAEAIKAKAEKTSLAALVASSSLVGVFIHTLKLFDFSFQFSVFVF